MTTTEGAHHRDPNQGSDQAEPKRHHVRFSIVMPAYNRVDLIGRAIESCLTQDYQSFEVIVVDDGSTDGTREAVRRLQREDARISLTEQRQNRGPTYARNLGVARAKGGWIVMLDTDMELLPVALSTLASRTNSASDDIGNVASSCLWDTGTVTPSPSVPAHPVGYREFLAWLDTLEITEWFNCIRREVYSRIRYPETRVLEGSFALDLAREWKIDIAREPAVLFRTDASNRITSNSPQLAIPRWLRDANDWIADSERILREHGSALRKWAPRRYAAQLRLNAMYHFLAGHRGDGVRFSLLSLRRDFREIRTWGILLSGLVGRHALAWLKTRPWRAETRWMELPGS